MLKTANGLKLWIECLMLIAMISLMDITTLGSFMHERIGLVLGLLAAVHLALDVRMIGPLLKRIGRRDTPYPMRLGYIVDVLLFIGMAVILVTGVGTSATIFTQVQLPRRRFFMDLHTYVSNITMLLMLGHLWLHKGWLRGMLRMTARRWREAGGRSRIVVWAASLAVVVAVTAVGVDQVERVIVPGGQGQGYGWQGGRGVVTDDRPIGDAVFDQEMLAQYDGKDGRPAYIAFDGLVYDVGAYFIQGEHHEGVHAGMDLTGQIDRRKCLNALNHCPIVGTWAEANS